MCTGGVANEKEKKIVGLEGGFNSLSYFSKLSCFFSMNLHVLFWPKGIALGLFPYLIR